jgi:hypothetical protein
MTTNANTNDLVISFRNHHVPDCGPPPAIEAGPGDKLYRGYFENGHGEQFVVEIDREAKTGVLRGGDAGWGNPVTVRQNRVEGIILNPAEYSWLSACWHAATGEQLEPSVREKMN